MAGSLIEGVVAVLATWRIAAFLFYEYGPWDMMVKVRNAAALRSTFWDKQLTCFWCTTIWAALIVWPLYIWCSWVLVPLALSGAAVLLSGGGRLIWREITDHGAG